MSAQPENGTGAPRSKPRASAPRVGVEWITLAIPLATICIGAAILYREGIFSSGVWEDELPTRVRFLRAGTPLYEQLMEQRGGTEPCVLAFYSESCPACRKLRGVFAQLAAGGGAEFVAVNVRGDGLYALAEKFQITHTPTVVFVGGKGDDGVVERYKGKARVAAMREFVDAMHGRLASGAIHDEEKAEL